MPVWFIWDGEDTVTVHSQEGARVRNLQSNPHVTLNFGGDGRGGDIVVLSGTATLDGAPRADRDSAFVEKYTGDIARIGHTPESFAESYGTPVRIRLERLRGH
jgi:PPOX class probable F420-dependent enzyme